MANVKMTIVPLVHRASLKRGFPDLTVESTLFGFTGFTECFLVVTESFGLGPALMRLDRGTTQFIAFY